MVRRISIFVLSCFLAVACSQSTLPTVPSSSGSPTSGAPPITNGAAISGTVVGTSTANAYRVASVGLTVSVMGSSVSAAVDSKGEFTLQGVPPGTVQLRFTGPGVDATVTISGVAEHDSIHITVRVSGNSAEIEDDKHENADHGVELEGTLSEITLAARTFRVSNTLVSVPAGTPIRHGDTTIEFSALRLGDRVHVKGTSTATGVTATEVKVQNSDTPGKPDDDGDDDGKDDDDHDNGKADLKGSLAGLGGTCPSITFTVSGTPVATNSKTKFEDVACKALKNGDTVEVEGTKQANGSVLASTVEKKK